MGDGAQELIIGQPLRQSGPANQSLAVARGAQKRCLLTVPAAPNNVIGNCVYYYRPYDGEIVNKTGVNFKKILDYAVTIEPFDIPEKVHIFYKLCTNTEDLIPPESTDPNWSRWHNFCARHVGCGHKPPSYYIAYGYYYCSNFTHYLLPRMRSTQGKTWLNNGRKLLHKYMELGLLSNNSKTDIKIPSVRYPNKKLSTLTVPVKQLEITPDKFKTFAFNSHVPAYLDAGIADVPIADLSRVFGQPNVEEWVDIETWKQAVDVAWEVVPHKVSHPLDTSGEVVDAGWQAGSYVFETNVNAIKKGAGYVVKGAGGLWSWVKSKF
ncbi:hypothetical protein DM558_12275 [Entomomonas moraniae]|uniref:Uncharacterized protein n=1 Tax=Entomomonas moraniae TaxID=2213226 RepID=A0A3S9XGD3_9GAMM|nr:hypothetical protein [Entomomonas moraniae]AZS51497.1 hypothetical protein DM558_12275 [Entomomonas moraniae]